MCSFRVLVLLHSVVSSTHFFRAPRRMHGERTGTAGYVWLGIVFTSSSRPRGARGQSRRTEAAKDSRLRSAGGMARASPSGAQAERRSASPVMRVSHPCRQSPKPIRWARRPGSSRHVVSSGGNPGGWRPGGQRGRPRRRRSRAANERTPASRRGSGVEHTAGGVNPGGPRARGPDQAGHRQVFWLPGRPPAAPSHRASAARQWHGCGGRRRSQRRVRGRFSRPSLLAPSPGHLQRGRVYPLRRACQAREPQIAAIPVGRSAARAYSPRARPQPIGWDAWVGVYRPAAGVCGSGWLRRRVRRPFSPASSFAFRLRSRLRRTSPQGGY